ncbi:uncharacterized protein LOC119796299 isoform X2 [Cyprinodon tularosa]|uniref:uncharacterized protein LOC119796299 isoform X2 n=1 Tax=Cyprinodon tularosa TaxID=77115 RepID=UPI0018E1F9BF|nr:uncharacterized protein LOC119796299 isoform X2 [Cyprinodon tularosa]
MIFGSRIKTVMFLSETGFVVMVLMLCVSGIECKPNSLCALKGSSVNLSCSAPHSAANMKWYSYIGNVFQDVPTDGNSSKFSISEDTLTLTIRDLTESDGKLYCCSETTADKPISCKNNSFNLHVTDLQVKVFPATEEQKVTLMCKSSCPLTESPAAFIWYQNREFLYEDWSHWYRELVSSDQAVRYSCAIKGYEDLRSPEVSVDSVSRSCFSVTYAGGRMCSYKQTEKQSCSITFPTEVHVERTETVRGHFKLNCSSSCSLTDLQTSFQLYKKTQTDLNKVDQNTVVPSSTLERFFCSVKDLNDLLSDEVCADGSNSCWTINYVSRIICALKGSSVNISSKYSHPDYLQPQTKHWYKVKMNTTQEEEQLMDDGSDIKNKHILRLTNLDQKDSGEYKLRIKADNDELMQSDYHGVTLIVTELQVDLRPAAEVTEGQRVTLTCSTSCPLRENTIYIWYLNSLSLSKAQNKQLIIDAVSMQDGGNYSCAVGTIRSAGKTLIVQRRKANWKPAAAGISAVLVILAPLCIFLYRKCKTSQSSRSDSVNNMDQIKSDHTYEEIAAQPAEMELHYSQLATEKLNPLYCSIQHHQKQEHVPYSEVKISTNTNSD